MKTISTSPPSCKPFSTPSKDGGAKPLPCLYSNNCIQNQRENGQAFIVESSFRVDESDITPDARNLANVLQPYHRKQAETLAMNISSLIRVAPSLGHVAFLTLTTEDNCSDFREFSKRWRSFRTNYLSFSEDFGHWVSVYERQRRGAWHLHLIIIVKGDIRIGCNFEEFERRKYRTAPAYLRGLWSELREVCKRYRFGRHELLPIKSSSEAISRYVGKYVSKHIGQRKEEDKGKHQIQCSIGWPKNTVKWAWHTEGSREWRRKLAKFAFLAGCSDMYQIRRKFGPRWAYHLAPIIYSVDAVGNTDFLLSG